MSQDKTTIAKNATHTTQNQSLEQQFQELEAIHRQLILENEQLKQAIANKDQTIANKEQIIQSLYQTSVRQDEAQGKPPVASYPRANPYGFFTAQNPAKTATESTSENIAAPATTINPVKTP